MIYRYVDFSLMAGSSTGGSQYSPMGRMAFFNDLLNRETLNDDLTYFLMGTYYSNDFCIFDCPSEDYTNRDIIISKDNTYGTKDRKIYFSALNNGTPWKFEYYNSPGNYTIRVIHDGNVNGYGTQLILKNGMIQTDNGSITIVHENVKSTCKLESMQLKAGGNNAILIPTSNNVEVNGSTLISTFLTFYKTQSVKLYNDILIHQIFPADSSATQKYVEVDGVVFSENLEDYGMYERMSIVGQTQDNWTSASIWDNRLSAYANSASNLDYLSSAFNTITISGNPLRGTVSPWSFDGGRDGVGFLYFTPIESNITQIETSGFIPYEAEVYFDALSNSASRLKINWDDGLYDLYYSGTSASHIFSAAGDYVQFYETRTKNKWYDFCELATEFNVYDSGATSAGLVVLNSNLDVITEGYVPNTYVFSANNIGGKVVSYKIDCDIGSTSAYDIDGISSISASFFYDYYVTSGSKIVSLNLNENLPNSFYTSASFNILPQPAEVVLTYYVDLEGLTSGTGTSSAPFDYDQFEDQVKLYGLSLSGAVYKLKGEVIISNTFGLDRPNTLLQADYRKNLVFDVWDAIAYGPWIISVSDDYYKDNAIFDLSGITLKNGIIYNQPQKWGSSYYGGTFKCSDLYNMWVVNQGINSEFYLTPVDNVNIYGSTIYSENRIRVDTNIISTSSYNINIYDSVINKIDLDNDNAEFSNSTFNVYNNCFGGTSATFNGLSYVTLSANQFDWEVPEDWPLLVGSDDFNKTITYIIQHRNDFAPFTDIDTPPNPGYGYSSYNLYQYGLFGFLRNLYDYKG